MNVHLSPRTIRYAFDRYDEVIVDGISFRPVSSNEAGHVFVRSDGSGMAESFAHAEMSRLVGADRIKHVRGRFLPKEAARRLACTVDLVSLMPDGDRARLEIRAAFVEAFLELERQGAVSRTDHAVKAAMGQLRLAAAEYLSANHRARGRTYVGRVTELPDEVSPRSLRRWLKANEASGMAGLADERSKCGNRGARFEPDEQALLASVVRGYLSPDRPTQTTITVNVARAFQAANEERAAQGLRPLRVPSREAVRRAIRALDPFQTDVARLGLEAARRRHSPVGQGLDLTRPLQRVEMDEWRIDLVSVMATTGLLDLLSEEDRERLGLDKSKDRWWLTVAMCCTSRCILGLRLSRQLSAQSAIETLHMAVRDKGAWADAVGALSPWDMHGLPELVVMDCGRAFKSHAFHAAMHDLGVRAEHAIAGMPQLRARIERLFGTISINLLPRLSGRTFSNVIDRGDYDSGARAALTVDELVFALIRWVVDIYHNSPHESLRGQSPAERWRDLVEKWGVTPPPDMRTRRLVFGTRMERVVGRNGIEVLGVRYHSDELARWALHSRERRVALRWYAEDIGAIEVEIDKQWWSVPAAVKGFQGVHAQHWLASARRLRATRQKQKVFDQRIVFEAIRAIEDANSAAMRRVGLVVDDWSEQRLAAEEDRLFVGFEVAENAPVEVAADDRWGIPIPKAAPGGEEGSSDEPMMEHAAEISPEPEVTNQSPDPVATGSRVRRGSDDGGWEMLEE